MKCQSARVVAPTVATRHFVEQPVWVKSGLVRRSKLSDYPISSSASESGSAEVAMHYVFAACD
jgi:hypothetical protein